MYRYIFFSSSSFVLLILSKTISHRQVDRITNLFFFFTLHANEIVNCHLHARARTPVILISTMDIRAVYHGLPAIIIYERCIVFLAEMTQKKKSTWKQSQKQYLIETICMLIYSLRSSIIYCTHAIRAEIPHYYFTMIFHCFSRLRIGIYIYV